MDDNKLQGIDITCTANSRKLTPGEAFQNSVNFGEIPQGIYFHSCKLSSKVEISESQVRVAFHGLSKNHMLLRSKLNKGEGENEWWFKEKENTKENDEWILLTTHKLKSVNEWLVITSKNLSVHFDIENDALWRVLWMECPAAENDSVKNYILVFIACHVICDAKSVTDLFSNQLLPLLNGKILEEKSITPFLKSMEDIFLDSSKLTNSIPWYIRWGVDFMWWKYSSFLSREKFARFTSKDQKRRLDGEFHFSFQIDAETSQNLFDFCKSQEFTVHSALCIVLMTAAQDLALASGIPLNEFQKLGFPIDLRKFIKDLNTSPMSLGMFTNMGNITPGTNQCLDIHSFITQASGLNEEVQKQNKPLQMHFFYAAILHMLNSNKDICQFVRILQNYPSIYFSNAGKSVAHVTGEDDLIEIKDQFFGVNTKDCIFISLLTVNNQMNFVLCYDNAWFDPKDVRKFAGNVTNLLKTLAISYKNM